MKKKEFFILAISGFDIMMGLGIIAPLMPIFAKTLQASGLWLGIIYSGYALGRLILMPIIGKLSDRFGRKIFITTGLLSYAILSLAYIFADNIYLLTWVRLLNGFASAMVIPIVMAYVGEIVPVGKEGKYMGYYNVSLFMGMGMGPFLGGFMNDRFGMDYAFYVMSVLSAIVFILTLIFLPENTSAKFKIDKNKNNASYKKLLSHDVFKGLLAFRFIAALGRGSILSFLPIFASYHHITATQIGIIISTSMIIMSFLQVPFGKLADRHSRIKLIILSGIVTIISLSLIPLAKSFVLLLFLNIFIGIGGALGLPAATAINTVIGKKYGMGSAMGLFSSAMSGGMFLAPLIAGVLMDTFGINCVFYFGSLMTLVGIIVFYLYTQKHKKEVERRSAGLGLMG